MLVRLRICTTPSLSVLQSSICIDMLSHPHYPLLCTITLASLVKGRWIDGKAQALILLLSACDMSNIFMLQTFLPSRRRDCLTSALCPTPTLPKPHYPLLCNITLASLVKGRWIDGKAQALILLLSACDMSNIFMLQTFLPSRRRDCLTSALCPTPTLPKPHYPLLCTITLAFK